jgi:protein O-mannosyl-transferase
MGKKRRPSPPKITRQVADTRKANTNPGSSKKPILTWLLILLAITAICFFPMLRNSFTNWDDEFYVIKNNLLRGPDWAGIFSEPVVGNYHPLTIISLAANYSISELNPGSYLVLNYLLHLANTCLVFYFIFLISAKKTEVAFITALIFGIHPMHVESVAWVSERKDVLYTLFFILALIRYWHYLQNGKKMNLWVCLIYFLLSLLSKPAAIILPFVLLLLDYWKGRPVNKAAIIEKISFFLLAFLFAVITLKIQSASAVVKLDSYPLWSRPLFGCYVIMIYFLRFFIPYPLSAFHPFPNTNNLGWPILVAPVFIISVAFLLWSFRKNRTIIFGSLFFIINLLLVAQIVSIGSSLVSERYTYVPYIGIGFMIGMGLSKINVDLSKPAYWVIISAFSGIFGYMTFQQIKVWKNSETLWSNVIRFYPKAPIPRTNRANYFINRAVDPGFKGEVGALYQMAIDDCNAALKNKPDDVDALSNRQNVYLNLNLDTLALADANTLIRVKPDNKTGYYTRGVIYTRWNQPDKALLDLNKAISLDATLDFIFAQRAFVSFTFYKKYGEALQDYSKAIELNPSGSHYLNRSLCYYNLGDIIKAKEDARLAMQKGAFVSEEYRKAINL